jgi:Flp pilus assembly protein TadG
VNAPGRPHDRSNQQGQIAPLLAVSMIVICLCVGLAVDVGFGFVAKARLTKAVDAATLTAMKNVASVGQTQATVLATNAFNANYVKSGIDFANPVVAVTYGTDTSGNTIVTANGTAYIKPVFMKVLPSASRVTVTDSAQATRNKLVMTIILDRSGSMDSNGGSTALPPAVIQFIGYFDNTMDQVGMTSFASNATLDYSIATGFKTPITSAVNAMNFDGGTFGLGSLVIAKAQNESVMNSSNQIKVVVYFTDGLVNTVQDTFHCTSSWGNTLYNYGGYDTGTTVDFFKPTDGTDWGNVDSNGYPPHSPTPDCTGVTKFTSQIDGTQKSFTRTNVTADAQYRSLAVANAMRSEGMYVYSIGLGSSPSQSFLKQIANDPTSSTYNSSQPAGLAVFATNCPSTSCNAQLQQVFQTIAAKILLRLTQ